MKQQLELLNRLLDMHRIDDHETFTSTSTNSAYVEGHHLIPCKITNSEKYNNRIDIVNNIVPLCPNCHRKIHYSIWKEREKMIKQL